MKKQEFYTAKELAEKLRVNIMTIYRYIKASKLRAYKMSKEFRIDKKEFNSSSFNTETGFCDKSDKTFSIIFNSPENYTE